MRDTSCMATISFRADERTVRALNELTADGTNRSEVIRRALVLAARQHRRDLMRSEALALIDDEAEHAEMRAVREDLASVARSVA